MFRLTVPMIQIYPDFQQRQTSKRASGAYMGGQSKPETHEVTGDVDGELRVHAEWEQSPPETDKTLIARPSIERQQTRARRQQAML
jgi:hypothetical protein